MLGIIDPLFGGGTVSFTVHDSAPENEPFRTLFIPAIRGFSNLDSIAFIVHAGDGLNGTLALDDIDINSKPLPAVPEPSALMLMGVGAAAGLRRLRAKRSRCRS